MASTYNNIGLVHKKLGNFPKALEYYEKSLEIKIECLGGAHVKVAETKENMAIVYEQMGELKKALEMYESVLETKCRTYGQFHEAVADTKNNIAIVYGNLGNQTRRLQLVRETHSESIYLKALGPEHPKTKGIAPFI